VARGTGFVTFRYTVNILFYSILCVSDVQMVEPGASRVVRGLRYSLLTAILGWWSLTGFLKAIRVLAANFGGGIDVSSQVLAVGGGEALLPSRDDGLQRRRWGWGWGRGSQP
jgi:hypothetical protein